MTVSKDMARRLRNSRIEAGFETIRQACDAFDWTYSTYVNHESGQKGFLRKANEYAEAYGIPVDWLLTGNRSVQQFQIDGFNDWPQPLREKFAEFIRLTNQSDPQIIGMILEVAFGTFRVAGHQATELTERKQSG